MSQRTTDLQLTLLCLGSDGNRRGHPPQSPDSDGTTMNEEDKRPPVRKRSNSPKQEEIIALFRRIQSSISKEESVNTETKNSNASEDKPTAASILKVLGRSSKQGKGRRNEKMNMMLLDETFHQLQCTNIVIGSTNIQIL